MTTKNKPGAPTKDPEDNRLDCLETLKIWENLETTSPAFTKAVQQGAFRYTSINPEYQFRKMTAQFGACGIGWGYEITSSEFHNGADMISAIKKDANDQPLNYGPCKIHTLRVNLWFRIDGDPTAVVGHIPATGHTPFIYMTKNGPTTDMEYEKKSVTDALTKAMAFLGMSADVRMGMFEDHNYVSALQREEAIENAVDKSTVVIEQKKAFDDWLENAMSQITTSVSIHELEILYKSGLIRIEAQGNSDQRKTFIDAKSDRLREIMRIEKRQDEITEVLKT